MSDLVNNTTRGVLAEYIVSQAVGASTVETREVWAAFDLITPEGIKIEVKSSSYLQSWSQSGLSSISFGISPSRAWDAESNTFSNESKRQADVYVFALLAHQDKSTINPLNLDQWAFFVLATAKLDTHFELQKTITLSGLEAHASPIEFEKLKSAVLQAASK